MIEPVDRPDDPRIAEYARVGDSAWLSAAGLFVAEGRFVVQRLLSAPRFRVRSLLVTSVALQAIAPPAAIQTYVADQSTLNAVTGFNFHRGCLALVERPSDAPLPDVAAGTRLLMLEGVSNPDNVGGLFRVAAAFGVSGVLLDPTSGDPFYRKAVRTSMGAALLVPHARLRPWPGGIAMMRERGFTIVALSPSASTKIQDVAARNFGKIALMVGAEGAGLSDSALAAADLAATIPMRSAIDSLNVTVAAGIALSHLAQP